MTAVKPIYLVALLVVILLMVYLKISNPYREYSTTSYWEKATLLSLDEIPIDALKPGNKNGPILMWAAMVVEDPAILHKLVALGAQINESDGLLKGTPLTGAAGYTKKPEIITELIELGADINKTVHNGETALMIAAKYNKNPGKISILLRHGAISSQTDDSGKAALEYAKLHKNVIAIRELEN